LLRGELPSSGARDPSITRKKIGVGMLGYAFMGKAHTNAFLQFPLIFPDSPIPHLSAISGRSEAALKEAARQFGYDRTYTDWHELLKDKDVKIVDNGLPNNLHEGPCLEAAELGKDIICEKPLGMDSRQSERMFRAVERAGVKHMVGYNYRFIPAIRLAKQFIEEGRLGKIIEFRAVYLQDWIMDPGFPLVWRLQKTVAGSGALGDLGTHVIDLARFLVGDIDSTVGMTRTFIDERPLLGSKNSEKKTGKVDVDDAFIALMNFKSGAIGSVEASRFSAGRKNFQRLEIHGLEGSLSFNLERLNELEFYSRADDQQELGFKTISVTEPIHPYYKNWWPPGHVIGWEHAMVHEMYHFFSAVAEDKDVGPWGATFYDGYMADMVADAITRSAASERWESVGK
jgi:predicted dehydrogenase